MSLIAAMFYSVSSAMLTRTLKFRWAESHAQKSDFGPGFTAVASAQVAAGYSLNDREQTIKASKFHRLTLGCATIAVIIHGWIVIHQTGLPHTLALPLFTSLSTTALTIVLMHIVICLRQPADYLGIAVYPLAAVTLIVSQASGGGTPITGSTVQIHVLLSLVSYAMLALAAMQAVLVSIQRHFLSVHKPGGLIRSLPPLDTTERLLFTLIGAGFVLLSLALLSGFVYLDNMFDQRVVHKTVLSCIGWGIFGTLLYGRWQFGWRGKKAVHWTLGGFGVLILAFFGTKAVIEFVLG